MIRKNPKGSRRSPVLAALPVSLSCLLFGTNGGLCNAAGAEPTTNNAAGFAVDAYIVQSSLAVPTNTFAPLLSKWTGTNVSLEDIGQAALALQNEYRKRGQVAIIAISPREISNRVVTLHVAQGAFSQVLIAGQRFFGVTNEITLAQKPVTPRTPSATNAPALTKPAPMKALAAATTNAIPPHPRFYLDKSASPAALAKAHEQLQREMVAAERRDKRALLLPGSETNTIPETTGPTFTVKRYEVTGNTLLPQESIDLIFEPYVGTNVSFEAIRSALKDFQSVYRERGFPTVSVALPQQTLNDGVVKVNVFEGRLSEILVVNNHYFSSNNVMRALPGLRTNMILTGPVFQAELDRANANQDRQIYPQIEPGLEENTTALRLKVNDRLPLHAKTELNNQSSPGTPEMRVNSSAVYNNLWQHEHSLGLQYSFSPELFKAGKQWAPYDMPLVANYSAFYRMPLGNPDPIADIIAARPGTFGYDEATRRFHLPPPSGRPELNVYASHAVIDTGLMTTFNDYVYNFGTNWLTQHDVQRDITKNDTLGARLTIPLLEANKSASFSGGLDYKIYDLVSSKTNIATLGEITGLPEGPVTNYYPNVVPSTSSSHLDYLPVSLRYDAVWRDPHGTTAFGMGISANAWHSGSISNLQSITGSRKSEGHWLVLTPSLTRDFIFHTNWTASLHTEAQWANEPLISNERFGAGGVANVRGYKEGEVFGDNGWRVNLDLKTPPHTVGTVYGKELLTVRGSLYMDYAETYLLDVPKGVDGFVPLWGTGVGTVISVGSHWDARLLFSVPLLKTSATTPGQPRFNFSITGQF